MMDNIKSSYFSKILFSKLDEGQKLKIVKYNKCGHIEFEGEYLNGKRWNGKGLDENGHIVYELKNGKGFVKEYDDYEEDKLKFEGEYLNGERIKGKEYIYDYSRNKIYEGEFKEGNRWKGKLKEYAEDKYLITDLDYVNGKKWNGKNYDEGSNIVFEIKDGKGYLKEDMFEGEYINGEKNGKGIEFNSDSDREIEFEGEYISGKRNGKGKVIT